jgi:hypothetical protein
MQSSQITVAVNFVGLAQNDSAQQRDPLCKNVIAGELYSLLASDDWVADHNGFVESC